MNSAFVQILDICEPLKWSELFPKNQPVQLDLGAGDGGFALALARQQPGINVLAVERLLGRARKIDKRIRREGLTNIRVLRLETAYTLRFLVPPQSVEVIHVMHPDPWPKKKHHKNRLFQPDFIAACADALSANGELRLTTDHVNYFGEAILRMADSPRFASFLWMPGGEYPRSDFQLQFAAEGKVMLRQAWRKIESNAAPCVKDTSPSVSAEPSPAGVTS